MSVVTEIITSNYLKQYFEVHCVFTTNDGNLKDPPLIGTYKSQPFSAPFCLNCKPNIQAVVKQKNKAVTATLSYVTHVEPVNCKYDVSIVKRDGSKVSAQNKDLSVLGDHEYLHDSTKLYFRYKIYMKGNVSRGDTGLVKLLSSIDGAFNDFLIQAVGGSIRVMKNVLSVKWKYFETMMDSKCIEYNTNKWIIEDVSIKTMRDIVGYVYCDSITIKDKHHAVELLEAGHRYLLDELVAACSKYLVAEVYPNNVLTLLVLSDKFNLAELKEKCLTVIPKILNEKDMKDIEGYAEYIRYCNHAKLTEACLETAVRKMMKQTELSREFRYNSVIVKCDGSKVEATKTNPYIPEEVAHEYLQDGNKIFFRYKITISGDVSQQTTCLLKLFRSIDGVFNDFQIQAVGGSIRVNKNILAMNWKFFETMMGSKLTEYTDNIWLVQDVSAETMRDIVGYVYCDAITIRDEYQAMELVEAGHRFLLDDLLVACSKYLVAEVNPGNVLSLLVLSDTYSLTNLTEKCLKFIPNVFSSKDMKDLDGYEEYTKYSNHAKLTEACLEHIARRWICDKKMSTGSLKLCDLKLAEHSS
ncbi:Protein maternal effect lethal 26 [Halotydeus destructor]|nr:Protein maternal effect lethal 26 [Halotydeus destructor]